MFMNYIYASVLGLLFYFIFELKHVFQKSQKNNLKDMMAVCSMLFNTWM